MKIFVAFFLLIGTAYGQDWVYTGASPTGGFNGEYHVMSRGGDVSVSVSGAQITGRVAEEYKRMVKPDYRQYLKFPLEVGMKWTADYSERVGRANLKYIVNYDADRMETVTVKAGTFEAIYIKGEGKISVPSGTVFEEYSIWYSHATKSIVKYIYSYTLNNEKSNRRFELVSYKPE